MEKNLKLRLLESIGKVYEQSKDCKLEPAFFEKVESELEFLSEYLKVTCHQAFIVAMVFALNYHGDLVDLNELIRYLDCNPMKILEFSDDFEILLSKEILSHGDSVKVIQPASLADEIQEVYKSALKLYRNPEKR